MSKPKYPITILAVAMAALLGPLSVHGQSIERVKMTDNDLSCPQIYGLSCQATVVVVSALANN